MDVPLCENVFVDAPAQLSTVEEFNRVTHGGELTVTGYTTNPINDEISPARITTLGISNINHVTRNVTVTWVSVGDDMDVGQGNVRVRYSGEHHFPSVISH